MSDRSATPPLTEITGGVAGPAATYAAVRALADRFDAAGDRMRGWAATGGRTLCDPDLLASAPLSPLTFADAEERVLAATAGTHGILSTSLLYEADALLVRATVDAFVGCDRLVASSFEVLDYAAGRTLGCAVATAAPYAVALGVVAVPASRLTWRHLPADTRQRLRDEAGDEEDAAQEWVATHPEAVQHLVDGSGGLLDGLLTGLPAGGSAVLGLAAFHPTLGAAASDLAAWYGPEGEPQVRRRPDLAVRLGAVPPGDLPGLMHHLAETDDLSPGDRPGDQGTIEVQTLTASDGSVRHVVYLPGTDDLTTTPFSQDGDVRDLPTNLRLIAGHDTTYAAGIEKAMTRAGIGPDDPVLLVGHSQGGMAAYAAAASPAVRRRWAVAGVLTAGSPLARMPVPRGVPVLALENADDVVPGLDGRWPLDLRSVTTARFRRQTGSIGGNHGLDTYAEAADALPDSPSVAAWRRSTAAFLAGGAVVSTRRFAITRSRASSRKPP